MPVLQPFRRVCSCSLISLKEATPYAHVDYHCFYLYSLLVLSARLVLNSRRPIMRHYTFKKIILTEEITMQLWNKQLESKAHKYPLYSQEGKGMNAVILAKFFNPYGAGTWLITEAEKQPDGDWLFFGYCHIFEWEWGYVTLSELIHTKVKVFGGFQLPLERDLYIPNGMTVGECLKRYGG